MAIGQGALRALLGAALLAGVSYYANRWIGVVGPAAVVWKGAGVALLALWAGAQARSLDGRLIASALALGAAGDVLLETHGLTVGALAFLAGHGVATALYLRRGAGPRAYLVLNALGVALLAALLAGGGAGAKGIAVYALGLGAMEGSAWTSRFPRSTVGLGAVLFLLSDLLIFARTGVLAGSPVPGLLIWPTYFAGQALIAIGVVTTLAREQAR
ncbi:lysoplasmalogenase family protein [Sphingomonas sp. CJ20]